MSVPCEEWSGLVGFGLGGVVVDPLGYGFGAFWCESVGVVVGSWSLVDCNWELGFVISGGCNGGRGCRSGIVWVGLDFRLFIDSVMVGGVVWCCSVL